MFNILNILKDYGHDGFVDDKKYPDRKRIWMALCYLDNEEMADWFSNVLPALECGYAGRIHDQEGKAHHHIVLIFNEAKTQSAVAKNASYPERWLRPWDSKRKAFRYLCHCDNPEKYQYSPDGIYGTLLDDALRCCSKSSQESETKTVSDILDLIDSIQGYVSFTDFCRICTDRGFWSTFRRMGAMGSRLVDEHNSAVADRRRQCQVLADFDRFQEYVASGKSKEVPFDKYVDMIENNNFPTYPL